MMKHWIFRAALVAALIATAVQAGHARMKLGKTADVDLSKVTMEVHLTTGDVLKGVEYISKPRLGGGAAFSFRSNFDAVIEIKLPYLMYIDFGPGGVALADRQMSAKEDEIHLKNGNLITGTIAGFSGGEVKIATDYGDQEIEVAGVKHIIFRNRSESPADMKQAEPAKERKMFESFKFRSRSKESGEEKPAESGEDKPAPTAEPAE